VSVPLNLSGTMRMVGGTPCYQSAVGGAQHEISTQRAQSSADVRRGNSSLRLSADLCVLCVKRTAS
jgi:hypothetical protein